jgi:predicted ATPase
MLSYRAWDLWMLGYPEAALTNVEDALRDARETAQAANLMFALVHASVVHYFQAEDATTAAPTVHELLAVADDKHAMHWKRNAIALQGWILARTGRAADAIDMFQSAIAAMLEAGAKAWMPLYLALLSSAFADLGQFEEAWRCISEAKATTDTTRETWCEAEVNRLAGEIALKSPERDLVKAQDYFERALDIARQQQAKSWELRATMSLGNQSSDKPHLAL